MLGQEWVGSRLHQNLLAVHTSCPLKTDSGEGCHGIALFVPLLSVTMLTTSGFSASPGGLPV